MDITDNSIEATLQVNKLARRNRHMRIFSRKSLMKIFAVDMLKYLSIPFIALGRTSVSIYIRRFFITIKLFLSEIMPVAPQKRLFYQAVAISCTMLIVSSFTASSTYSAVSVSYSTDYVGAYSSPSDVFVSDEDGYLVKTNPQTDDSNRIGMTDYAVHTVESGETLSQIAAKYSVSVNTIMWENNLKKANSIRSGQKLLVPPVDGVSYKVAGSDTLDKISKKYNISSEAIIAQNGLASDAAVIKGETLFLPGAQPLASEINIASNSRVSTGTRSYDYSNVSSSNSAPSVGRIFIKPTKGGITQGYHSGHYAIDIADASKPPIWAAGGGTVTKVSTGTWGGGYGNHVMIDHGGGLVTLYAHMDSVNVYQGQWVNQGDVIGIMGNTGRVYGVTGIHLHFEVIQDGVKQNPAGYY